MVLDLSRFTQNIEGIFPIVNGWGKLAGRKVKLRHRLPDGWYFANSDSNTQITLRPATSLEKELVLEGRKKYKGYLLNDEIIPVNFNNWFKDNRAQTLKVHFTNGNNLSYVEFVQWEDGRLFFYQESSGEPEALKRVREAVAKGIPMPKVSGLTPEIRFGFMFASIFNTANEARTLDTSIHAHPTILGRIARYQASTLEGSIRNRIEKAGGIVDSIVSRGKGLLEVMWKINMKNGASQNFKTIVTNTGRVESAGFCLSGFDKQHTIASLVNLAYIYNENDDIYITRE